MKQRLTNILRILPIFLLGAISFYSCKNSSEEKKQVQEKIEVTPSEILTGEIFRGEFLYTPEAAVLSTPSTVYGVKLNDMAQELAKRVEAVKKDDYDIVPVSVEGQLSKKPEGTEGWEEIITITRIISVSNTPVKADVKI